MAGFEKEFILDGSATRWQRLRRDWILGKHLLRVFWMWLTVGRKLRRAYRQAEAESKPIPIDALKRGRV
jgi:hypothetical protein